MTLRAYLHQVARRIYWRVDAWRRNCPRGDHDAIWQQRDGVLFLRCLRCGLRTDGFPATPAPIYQRGRKAATVLEFHRAA